MGQQSGKTSACKLVKAEHAEALVQEWWRSSHWILIEKIKGLRDLNKVMQLSGYTELGTKKLQTTTKTKFPDKLLEVQKKSKQGDNDSDKNFKSL